MSERNVETTLGDIRVLDLANQMGAYSTKLLADLGADVIKIEPPEGDPTRKLGPFVNDEPHPEKSLCFLQFNTNKRSITLNFDTADGKEILRRLVKSADVFVETFPPGYMKERGLDYESLSKINPSLIFTSITGFGQTGPYRDFKASDIVAVAMGGFMYLSGLPEDPPHRAGASQGYYLASANAAIGILTALHYRDLTGEGQWIDISMRAAVLRASETAAPAYAISKKIRKRTGLELYRGIRDYFPCKDGWVVCSPLGAAGADAILKWMEEEGMAADLRNEKYEELLTLIAGRRPSGKVAQVRTAEVDARRFGELNEKMAHLEEVWQAWLMTHTRRELQEGCQRRNVRLMPINNARDLLEDPHLQARNFFVEVEHPGLGTSFKYPGPPYRLSRTPCNIKRAPLLGEHNLDVYEKELGLSRQQLVTLAAAGVI